jgi:hypothetical protein
VHLAFRGPAGEDNVGVRVVDHVVGLQVLFHFLGRSEEHTSELQSLS